jgi:hypothetical protein
MQAWGLASLQQISNLCKGKRDMRRILTLCACVAVFSALALAESWTGRLVDASCIDQQKGQQKTEATCDPTSSTTMFALEVSGKVHKFDDAGNAKAAEALKSRADRSANPNNPAAPPSTKIAAKVTGTKEGENLKVEAIEVQ